MWLAEKGKLKVLPEFYIFKQFLTNVDVVLSISSLITYRIFIILIIEQLILILICAYTLLVCIRANSSLNSNI
ncbi:hypothetical protein LCGC14_1699800 [marine sediment metagenome]|uniref:Uncharacterized protein n=1 Tax=marine sediment metagenome TaxID=412755 RepID=A0A0F9HIY3_9ZZZZ